MSYKRIAMLTAVLTTGALAQSQAASQAQDASQVQEASQAQPPAGPQTSAGPQASSQAGPPIVSAAPARKGKQVYTGPNTVIQLPPMPMLDEEGKQRLDPDGKPMFNTPVCQQRDKKGHPLFDEAGKPVMQTASNLGYDEHGHRIQTKKEKPPKTVAISIARGTLTVDGMTGKAGLNYEIADLKYLYLYAPWVGLTIVSNEPFPGATQESKAFDGNTLTVSVADHTFQLYSDRSMLGKHAEPAYVLVDREFTLPTRFPVMGYGTTRRAPYAWPGSHENEPLKGAVVQPPPLPLDLRPVTLLTACPAGQMRPAGPRVLPGQTAPPQPCAPISQTVPLSAYAAPAPQGARSVPPQQVDNR